MYLRKVRRLYGETLVINLGRRLVKDKVLWRGKGGRSRSVDPKRIERGQPTAAFWQRTVDDAVRSWRAMTHSFLKLKCGYALP